jgi:hypothetical protein
VTIPAVYTTRRCHIIETLFGQNLEAAACFSVSACDCTRSLVIFFLKQESCGHFPVLFICPSKSPSWVANSEADAFLFAVAWRVSARYLGLDEAQIPRKIPYQKVHPPDSASFRYTSCYNPHRRLRKQRPGFCILQFTTSCSLVTVTTYLHSHSLC